MERGFLRENAIFKKKIFYAEGGFYSRQVEENNINRGSYLFLGDANDGKCRVHKCRRDDPERQIGCGDE